PMSRWLSLLLVGIPAAWLVRSRGGSDALVFAASALALVPLALWIKVGTEHLASRLGSALGGLLNATFGNAAELIITLFALKEGLPELVKASIVGSILSNTLFGLGASAVVGGLRHGTQRFALEPVRRAATMMILAVSALALPAAFAQAEKNAFLQEEVSVGIAILMLATYAAFIVYSHFGRGAREHREPAVAHEQGGKAWGLGRSFAVLAGAVVATAAASELLVGAVEPVSKSVGLSPFFVGIVVIPLVGNVAEYYSAVEFARSNRIELSFAIGASSSIQVAVFVAPCLVLASLFIHPMSLIFRPIELVALVASSAVFAYASLDGETDWLEGAQLLALYLICAVTFFFVPS
ncbi:MAG TPA: calcium/proton exchanger, partial [Thermoanaerobaculia bacterium]|nr:calcium/proton exchanger [Thermoanaerobaculia bacterium]